VTGSSEVRRTASGLTLPRLWAFIAVALPVVAALVAARSTVDLAYAVRAGQLMLDGGAPLRADPFTFAAGGRPWVDQQWGAQLVFGALYDTGGWALLSGLRAALVGTLFALVYSSCRESGAGTRTAAMLTIASFAVSVVALALRPQLLGMVLFALTIRLVLGRHRHPRGPWLIPLVLLLWANVHGSFFLGPLVVGFGWLEDRRARVPGSDRLLVVAAASALATLINPWGPGAWAYAVGLSVSPTIRSLLVEWQPTSPFTFVGAAFFASVAAVVGSLVVMARRGRGSRPFLLRPAAWPSLLWLGLLAALGVYAERGVVWWALGAPAAAAGLLVAGCASAEGVVPPRPDRRAVANLAIAGAVVLAGVLVLPWWRASTPADGALPLLSDAPTGITRAVRDRATALDRLFVPQALGSWFEFAVPGAPVFVDSRIELFPASIWDDYLAVVGGRDTSTATLDRWGVTLLVVRTSARDLRARLAVGAGWRLAYEDADYVLFARVGPGQAP